VVDTDGLRVEHVKAIFQAPKQVRARNDLEMGSSVDFGFKPFIDFFPFFAEASSSVKVGKFYLFDVVRVGKGLNMWLLANSGRGDVGIFNDYKPEKRFVFQWIRVCG
jgi:hypothetical protein